MQTRLSSWPALVGLARLARLALLVALVIASAAFAAPPQAGATSGLVHYVYLPVAARPPRSAATPAPAPAGPVYYVAPTGSDANPGSAAQPWRTVARAANTVTAGATVYIRAGTYHERVAPRNSGSAGKYVTFAAYDGETVTLDGSVGLVGNWQGLFDVSGRSYIRVIGLTLINSDYAGLFASNAHHILFQRNHIVHSMASGIGVWDGSTDVVADGNDVENSNYGGGNEAISFGGVANFEIKNNRVHNPAATASQPLKEGIDVKQGSHDGTVHHNTVDSMQKVAVYVDAYDRHTYNIQVFANVVHDAPLGFVLASEAGGLLENVQHYNNLAYNIQHCGIRVFGKVDTDSHPMQGIALINNTVYGSGCGIDVSNAEISGFVVRNNLLSKNGMQLQINVSAGLLTIDHNLIDGASSTLGSSYVQGDPRFQDAAHANFQLQAASPAIDRGAQVAAPADDLDGCARPHGPGYDIGAYEY